MLGGTLRPWPVENETDLKDIILDADPALDIGVQRKNGLGSFFNFKVSHLISPDHLLDLTTRSIVRSRNTSEGVTSDAARK